MKKTMLILAMLVIAAMIAAPVSAAVATIGGPSMMTDASLRSDNPNVNMGQNVYDRSWRMFADSQSVQRHHLMGFDLSSIATPAAVQSATLSIYIRRYNNAGPVTDWKLSRLQNGKSWVEGTNDWQDPAYTGDVTWNSQAHNVSAWQTAGATGAQDIDLATTISWNWSAADGVWATFDLTNWVQDWVNGSWQNNGILFWGGVTANSNNSNDYYWSYTSESAEVNRLPYLTVNYTVVPEPSSMVALGTLGLGALGFIRRRRA
jgi:hypothetical protein